MKPVRVLVVGAGNWGRVHARTLAGITEAELVGVVDRDERAINALREDLPAVRGWAGLDEACRAAEPEACVIATRTATHVDLAKRLLERGVGVLIEKPLADDIASAEALRPLVKPDSSNLMVGHVLLFAAEFRRLLEEVRRRGPVRYFHAVRHRPRALGVRFAEEHPIRLLMVHDLYLALALMNEAAPVDLHARMRPRGDGGCDLAEAQLRWSDETFGSFTASFMTPAGMPADGFDRFEVFGDDWAARLDLNPQPIQLWSDRAEWPLALDVHDNAAAPSGLIAEELRCFCRVVRGQAAVPVGARYQDAQTVQHWIDQLERSAGLGRPTTC